MDNLILIAAAVPFVIIAVVFTVLATIRCRVTGTHLILFVLGLPLRNIPFEDITSVEYLPPEKSAHWGVFNRGGVVVVEYAGPSGKGAMSVSPADAEGVSKRLKETVKELTGREV